MKTLLRVGTNRFTYLQTRNFAGLPFERYAFERVYDPFQAIAHAQSRFLHKPSHWARNLYQDFGLNRCDILHFFNTVSAGSTPWVVSFSSFVPRWRGERGKPFAVGLLARDTCKQLIAISSHSAELQKEVLSHYSNDLQQVILPKLRVMHPAQQLLVDSYDEKPLADDRIVFTIVGAAFFRKGGAEILRAASALIDEGYALELNIISSMGYGDYASRATGADLAEAMTLIARYPEQIHHYQRLPNSEVLDLFRASHVGLLPTYDDAYGYSVLEAQAAGCPVITTDIRVMPEINDVDSGWLIEVPTREFGQGVLSTSAERGKFSRILQEGLYTTMKDIINHPEQIRPKGIQSLNRIRCSHNPAQKAQEFEHLYDQILGLTTQLQPQLTKIKQ